VHTGVPISNESIFKALRHFDHVTGRLALWLLFAVSLTSAGNTPQADFQDTSSKPHIPKPSFHLRFFTRIFDID
jgi:hypothetical protein